MQKEKNPLSYDDLMEVADKLGLHKIELSSFTKIVREPDAKRPAVTVAQSKKVTRVYLVGFTIEDDAVLQIDEETRSMNRMGRIQAELDFSKSSDDTLSAFESALSELAELDVESRSKKKPKTEDDDTQVEAANESDGSSDEEVSDSEESESFEPDERVA